MYEFDLHTVALAALEKLIDQASSQGLFTPENYASIANEAYQIAVAMRTAAEGVNK